jgi:predicted transcriptional regulator
MKLRGGFRVGQIWTGSPDQIWSTVRKFAGVSRSVFDSYYEGKNVAFALEILDVWEYAHPRSLAQLRERFPEFVAPQSYRYVKDEEVRSFRALKRLSPTNRLSIAS